MLRSHVCTYEADDKQRFGQLPRHSFVPVAYSAWYAHQQWGGRTSCNRDNQLHSGRQVNTREHLSSCCLFNVSDSSTVFCFKISCAFHWDFNKNPNISIWTSRSSDGSSMAFHLSATGIAHGVIISGTEQIPPSLTKHKQKRPDMKEYNREAQQRFRQRRKHKMSHLEEVVGYMHQLHTEMSSLRQQLESLQNENDVLRVKLNHQNRLPSCKDLLYLPSIVQSWASRSQTCLQLISHYAAITTPV